MSSILVTGVAGFIGFYLCQKLLSKGDTVIGLDNLNDYYDVKLKCARLQQLKENENFSFYKLNLADRESITKLFRDHQFDIVVNLAAQAGVRYSIKNPHAYTDFIEVLESHLGKKAQKNFLPMQPGDVEITYADVDELVQDVGFKPNTPIEVGLEKFTSWFKSYYSI
ncbi:MAG: GDP-mannose 4,6-dehydratase [Rhizonema sp. PD38]|nr:GDP-mannose 4,6-dehydratase [Rhizonema sp. PD38]